MKNKWLVLPALLLVMSLVFLGCDDGSKSEPIANLEEVTFDGSAITLEKVGSSSNASVSGNTYTLLSTSNESSTGFVWTIPPVIDADAGSKQKDYEFVEITLEIVSITTPTNGVAFNAKTSRSIGTDVNRWGETKQYKNNLDILAQALDEDKNFQPTGITVGPGAKNSAIYPLNNSKAPYTKPFEGEIAFQWNNWSDDLGGTEGTKDMNFTVKVASIKFIPYPSDYEEPPEEEPPEAVPVLDKPAAGEVTLGEFTWINNANQQGWKGNGTDGDETDLDIAALVWAKYLVLELTSLPQGGTQIVWQGDGGGGWNGNPITGDDGSADAEKGVTYDTENNTMKIELSKALTKYDEFVKCEGACKVLIQYYGPDGANVSNLGYINAKLIIE